MKSTNRRPYKEYFPSIWAKQHTLYPNLSNGIKLISTQLCYGFVARREVEQGIKYEYCLLIPLLGRLTRSSCSILLVVTDRSTYREGQSTYGERRRPFSAFSRLSNFPTACLPVASINYIFLIEARLMFGLFL